MSNETYWALKRREWAAREQRSNRNRSVPLRGPQPRVAAPAAPVVPAEEIEATAAAVVAEEPSYRDLQAEAKELGIKANQPAEDLKKAIEKA